MISGFVSPSDLVTSIKEPVKEVVPLFGVSGDATVEPSPVSGAVSVGSRVQRGAVNNRKQERSCAAHNVSKELAKHVLVLMTDDETPPRPRNTRSGRCTGRSGRQGGTVETPRSLVSPAMPPPPQPPASRGACTQGTARKGKHQVKDSFNRLKGWIHGGLAGGGDHDYHAQDGVPSSTRGSARKAPKEERGAPSAAGVSTTEAAILVVDSKGLKVTAVASRTTGARHRSTLSSSESVNMSSSDAPTNSGLARGDGTLNELGHMTVVKDMRKRSRIMDRPLQAASAGLSPSPSPSHSTSSSVSAPPFQLKGEGSTADKTGAVLRRVKVAAGQESSTSTLAPNSGHSKTSGMARIQGTTVTPRSAADRTMSSTCGVPDSRFRRSIESIVPVRTPPNAGGETRTRVDGLPSGGRGREGTAMVANAAGASCARSHRRKISTRVRAESTSNGKAKKTAVKGSRSRTARK